MLLALQYWFRRLGWLDFWSRLKGWRRFSLCNPLLHLLLPLPILLLLFQFHFCLLKQGLLRLRRLLLSAGFDQLHHARRILVLAGLGGRRDLDLDAGLLGGQGGAGVEGLEAHGATVDHGDRGGGDGDGSLVPSGSLILEQLGLEDLVLGQGLGGNRKELGRLLDFFPERLEIRFCEFGGGLFRQGFSITGNVGFVVDVLLDFI